MNVSDSERLATFLEERGLRETSSAEEAALVIINTCGVRQMAEDRVYSFAHKIRTRNSRAKIIITGCIAHRKDVQRRLQKKADLFTEIKKFPQSITDILHQLSDANLKIQKNFPDKEELAYLSINPKHANPFQAYVPIMTGCNNFCAYCVVPYARGREVSRDAKEVVAEVSALVKKGYKLITLLGQNVNSYSSKLQNQKEGEINFAKLLGMLDEIPGKFWLTFVSSHPKDMSDELIETISKSQKVCEAVHLPLQSGSDDVIRRMNRHYTQKHYLQLIRKIRTAFAQNKPHAPLAITTDIIVGFPGESRAEFLETKKVMDLSRFDMAYFGQFSPRPGTAAWNMPNDVSKQEKEKREKELNDVLLETALANNAQLLGKKLDVLIEKKAGNFYCGKTRALKNIRIRTKKVIPLGEFVQVEIVKILPFSLEAKI